MFRSLPIAILLVTGCTTATDEDTGAADTDGNETSQLGAGAGKGDGATTRPSTDPRLLQCRLEYETFTPPYGVRPAADFDVTFAKVENEGAWASDGAYLVSANTNKQPTSNLSFVVMILDAPTGNMLSYNVMPRPHVGGAYLFEIGAKIPPVTFPNETTSFDFLRAYCSIRMP